MGKLLHYLGDDTHLVKFRNSLPFEDLISWLKSQKAVQFDTETNVTDSIVERELMVLQFGSITEQTAYIVQWSFLTDVQKQVLCTTIAELDATLIIHVSSFEYQIMKKQGCLLNKVWDTFLAEQSLYAGYDYDYTFYALKEVLLRRYGIDMSKAMQTEFGDDIMTDEKLIYAAEDVMKLGDLCRDQYRELAAEDKLSEVTGEYSAFEVRKCFSDMEYNGMAFYEEPWRKNITKAEPIIKEAKEGLAKILHRDAYDFVSKLTVNFALPSGVKVETTGILTEDTFLINWGSPKQVLPILQIVFPDMTHVSKTGLKEYLIGAVPEYCGMKPNSKAFLKEISSLKGDKYDLLRVAILNGTEVIAPFFKDNYEKELIEMGVFYKKDSIMVNWNSNNAKLAVFQQFVPELESTGAEKLKPYLDDVEFFRHFAHYQFANSLLTKYGEAFIEEQVDSDGRVRTNFNTILVTNRVSSSQPNMQNVPKSNLPPERTGDYRNCFGTGDPNRSMVSADFSAQEICILAVLSKDPVFLNALEHGQDVHSVASEVVYGQEWVDATAEGCVYYKLGDDGLPMKQKCSCPEHKRLRNAVKTISFGLCYGMSTKGLAVKLLISVEEAKETTRRYFASFPAIKKMLDSFALYGMTNGYIRGGGVTNFKRYFPYWKGLNTARGEKGRIERASQNHPIQSLAALQVKIAMVNLRKEIIAKGLEKEILPIMQVHDELNLDVDNNYLQIAADMVKGAMEEAGRITLGNNLLKAEPEITDRWYSNI